MDIGEREGKKKSDRVGKKSRGRQREGKERERERRERGRENNGRAGETDRRRER
jgi:hypothetical protein